jgi:membrane protease YdiL (CAAX protease family)
LSGPRPDSVLSGPELEPGAPAEADEPLPDDVTATAMLPSPPGPPGGGIFTLEGRRAPGLYLVAWILSVAGLVLLLLIGPMASAEGARLLLVTGGAVLLTLGLAMACGYQVLERRERPVARYRGPSPLLVFLTYLMAFVIIGTVVFLSGILDPEEPYGFFAVGTLQAIGYAVLVWIFVIRTGALSWPQMGWPTWQGPGLRLMLRAIGEAVAVMLPATFALAFVGGILALILDVKSPSVIPEPQSSAEALAIAAAAALIIPIGEELFFRGFALTAWLRDLGPRSALVRSALFFALIHIANISTASFGEGAAQALLQTVVLLPVGFVLVWLFLRRGMAAAIAGHVTYNSLLLSLSLLVSTLPKST